MNSKSSSNHLHTFMLLYYAIDTSQCENHENGEQSAHSLALPTSL
jgi:hypothetical protein